MAQDCERTFADTSMGINFVFHGEDTLVSELWKLSQAKENLQSYKDVFNV